MRFQKPPTFASLLTILGLYILFSLGHWQLSKYITFETAGKIQTETLNGLLSEPIVPVGPRIHDDVMGYHLYVPLMLENDQSIFVNLGWSPYKDLDLPENQVHIEGYKIPSFGKNMFALKSNFENKEFYALDLLEISEYYKLDQVNMTHIFYAQNAQPEPLSPFIPAQIKKSYLSPEMHLQYALFWFSMALALCVIFVLRFILKKSAST